MALQPGIDEAEEQDWLLYSQNFHSDSSGFQAAILDLTNHWKTGFPPTAETIETIWLKYSSSRSTRFLIELIKADQAGRVKRNLDASLDQYFGYFKFLEENRQSAVSLAYAEFCQLQEAGRTPSINAFCEKYGEWENSIRQQLELHRLLSIPSNELARSEATARHFPRAGESIEHFELVRELGRGGSARVFLARDTSLGGRSVALKISADRSTEPEILARLEHNNIVPILSVHDAEDGLRLICMPYRGELTLDDLLGHSAVRSNPRRRATDLLSLIREHPKSAQPVAGTPDRDDGLAGFPHNGSFEDAIAWIGCKLAEALAFAHSHGIFHRDIKPANVLVSLRSGPQLLDFNMARDPNALAQVEDRIRGGTLPYMAPEQLAAFHDASLWQEIGVRSDVYSLGLVLRELALGERTGMPLSPRTPVVEQVNVLLSQRSRPWQSLAGDTRRISHAFDAIINKCLTFSPMGRYASAADLAEDFQRLLDRRPLKSARNQSIRERTLVRLRPVRLALLPAIVLAFIFLRPHTPSTVVAIPGVDASVIEALTDKNIKLALEKLLNEPIADNESTTPRSIIKLIALSEVNPANPNSNDLINLLVVRDDLDKSVAQVGGVIGQSKHLDFLILYRDFLLLEERVKKNPDEVGQIEWQSLESRFMKQQAKWPGEIRTASLLAYLASKRDDFATACEQIETALRLMKLQGLSDDAPLAVDLRHRQILYTQKDGLEKQRNNLPAEAGSKYARVVVLVNEFRNHYPKDSKSQEMADFLARAEVESIIGQGDVETDQLKYDKALEYYRSSESLLANIKDQFIQPSFAESTHQQLERRIETILQLMKDGLTANPCE